MYQGRNTHTTPTNSICYEPLYLGYNMALTFSKHCFLTYKGDYGYRFEYAVAIVVK